MSDPNVLREYEYRKILKNSPTDKVYCYCVYEGRHIPKELGFKWDPELKVWYIPKKDFTLKIYNDSQIVRFTNHTTIGEINYYYVFYIEGDINKYKKEQDRKIIYKKMGNNIYPKKSNNKKIPKIDIDSIDFLDD